MTAATSQSSTSNGMRYRRASRHDPTARACNVDGTGVARVAAEQGGDTDTVDLLTAVVSAFEKHA